MSVITMETFMCAAPEAVHRVQRFDFAVHLLRDKVAEREARKRVAILYGCSEATAWRTVEAAKDFA